MKFDLLIKNGLIADGSGGACYQGDVGVIDGRIMQVGNLAGDEGKKTIDAEGLVVAPGFIDVHAHSELDMYNQKCILAKISQGITTELTGQCGISAFPVMAEAMENIAKYIAPVLGKIDCTWPWQNLEGYRKTIENVGIPLNQGNFIGHGNLRINAMGFLDRKSTASELELMKFMLKDELKSGALGLSSGLVYAPGIFSNIDEMVELAKVCAEAGKIYTTHMRSEAGELLPSVEEAIQVARLSGVQLTISHIKAMGRFNHGKVRNVLEMLDSAVAEGLVVYGDCYPYAAASTTMTIILPPWTLEKGIPGLLEILQSNEMRERIKSNFKEGIKGWENRPVTIGWENLIVASVATEKNRSLEGRSLADAATENSKDPADILFDLLLEEKGNAAVLITGMNEKDVASAISHPRVMICSDGIPVGNKPHPRLYGAITRYLSRYADLSDNTAIGAAIYKLTGLPAKAYKLRDIGLLKTGYWADITLIDTDKVKDLATFNNPFELSEGIERVIVSGEVVYKEKKYTGAKPGRFIINESGKEN